MWSPVSCRLSAGQWKLAGQRPVLYRVPRNQWIYLIKGNLNSTDLRSTSKVAQLEFDHCAVSMHVCVMHGALNVLRRITSRSKRWLYCLKHLLCLYVYWRSISKYSTGPDSSELNFVGILRSFGEFVLVFVGAFTLGSVMGCITALVSFFWFWDLTCVQSAAYYLHVITNILGLVVRMHFVGKLHIFIVYQHSSADVQYWCRN